MINRSNSPEMMLHCLNSTRDGTEMSVLERQRGPMRLELQDLQQNYFSGNEFSVFSSLPPHSLQFNTNNFAPCPVLKSDPGLEIGWDGYGSGLGSIGLGINVPGFDMNSGISRTSSCPPAMPESVPPPEKLISALGRESFKKRKAYKLHNLKDEIKEKKRLKGCAEEEDEEQQQSKITTETKNSGENSKVSEVEKPDYIHVRARRGQATDSHSLAERVRREKISERMKYLQDIVPGCNKITGKAGMLDEIINYVQSLQRQVEFLSMKLAAVNPGSDCNIDSFFDKEVFEDCTSTYPTIGVSSEMGGNNQGYLQFNPIQPLVSCCELDMGISSPLDSSFCNQIQPSSVWNVDFQNLYEMEVHQGRSTLPNLPYSSEQLTGSIEASSLKMEM